MKTVLKLLSLLASKPMISLLLFFLLPREVSSKQSNKAMGPLN